VSPVSRRITYIENPTVPIRNLEETKNLTVPHPRLNEFDFDDFKFGLNYRPEWRESISVADIISFDNCEDMPSLSIPRVDDYSSDDF
jgi:hypothetical protein